MLANVGLYVVGEMKVESDDLLCLFLRLRAEVLCWAAEVLYMLAMLAMYLNFVLCALCFRASS